MGNLRREKGTGSVRWVGKFAYAIVTTHDGKRVQRALGKGLTIIEANAAAVDLAVLASTPGATFKTNRRSYKKRPALAEVKVGRLLGGQRQPVVYFIQVGDDGPIKIGMTFRCIHKRIKALKTGTPGSLRLVLLLSGERDLERTMHNRFDQWRIEREWFSPSANLIEFIKEERRVVEVEKARVEADESMSLRSRAIVERIRRRHSRSMQRAA